MSCNSSSSTPVKCEKSKRRRSGVFEVPACPALDLSDEVTLEAWVQAVFERLGVERPADTVAAAKMLEARWDQHREADRKRQALEPELKLAEDLVEAIVIVASGEALLAPSITRRLLDRVASRLPPAQENAVPALAELTDRELEVLKLVTIGQRNREIATELGISENTVKFHLKNIVEKLHAQNRAELAARAVREGLVPDTYRHGGVDGPRRDAPFRRR